MPEPLPPPPTTDAESRPDIRLLPYAETERQPFTWGELTWFANAALGNTREVTVGRCILHPGQGNPRHYHPNCEEILTVLRGRIRHTGPAGQPREMGEGDTVAIPPNIWHHAVNIGEGPAVLLIVFSSAHRQTIGE
jgi:quercetin dioxygenase-like cupin family protein